MWISRHGTANDDDELIFNDFPCGETVRFYLYGRQRQFFELIKLSFIAFYNIKLEFSCRQMTMFAKMNTLIATVLIKMQEFATASKTNATKKFQPRIQLLLQIQDPDQDPVQQQLVRRHALQPVPIVHLPFTLDFLFPFLSYKKKILMFEVV